MGRERTDSCCMCWSASLARSGPRDLRNMARLSDDMLTRVGCWKVLRGVDCGFQCRLQEQMECWRWAGCEGEHVLIATSQQAETPQQRAAKRSCRGCHWFRRTALCWHCP